MKRTVKFAIATLATATLVMLGACTAPTQPLQEPMDCVRESAIEVYMAQYRKIVEVYADSVAWIFHMFHHETGKCKVWFELLRSRGDLPILTRAPYAGWVLQSLMREASGGFRLGRLSIMRGFLLDKGLFGQFTIDNNLGTMYLLHGDEVFFVIRLEEDFRQALLLLLDFQSRGRSVIALAPIIARDEFGREQHFGPTTWPVLNRWNDGLPRTVYFFYELRQPLPDLERGVLNNVFEMYRQAFASIGLSFRAYNAWNFVDRLLMVNGYCPYFFVIPYHISFEPMHSTFMGRADVGADRRRHGSPVRPDDNKRIIVNTEYRSHLPQWYDVYGNLYDFRTQAARRSFMTSFLLFAVGRALGLGSMESHPDFQRVVSIPGPYIPTDFNLATTVTNSPVPGVVSIITTRNDTRRHAVINREIDLHSVMFLPSYNSMRLGGWVRSTGSLWNNRLYPNARISAGDRDTLRFIYITHRDSPIWVTRL